MSVGGPPTNQVTGASEVTVSESSVVLDPAVRSIGLPQVYHEVDPLALVGESRHIASSE